MEPTGPEILKATPAVLGDDPRKGFQRLAKLWHPDHNAAPEARAVFDRLVYLRDVALGAVAPVQERIAIPGGELVWLDATIVLSAPDCIPSARVLASMRVGDLDKRVPVVATAAGDSITINRPYDSVPLVQVLRKYPAGVPAVHVAWMASRLYELAGVTPLESGYSWCGLVPESLLVLHKAHGVLPLDPRFVTKTGERMARVPEALVPLVPTDRRASVAFELACVNRIAMILLGDPSGTGNILRLRAKSDPEAMPPELLAWFRAPPGDGAKAYYRAYRSMLERVFGVPKYHVLEV